MKRIIEEKLRDWKLSSIRKPLLVRGARQVGKTHTIENFGNSKFTGKTSVFNFERNPEFREIFKANLDPKRIIGELELIIGQQIIPGSDLLFFDEIQDCPEAISALRYFYEEFPELHIIGAGSLLEFGLQQISVPVGRIQSLNMHPMNFVEFLWATGKETLADRLLQGSKKFSSIEINIINKELEKYFLIGGMPECIQAFAQNNSYQQVVDIQTDLLSMFRQDFPKYVGRSDKDCLNQVINSVSRKVGKQIKYSQLSQDFSIPTIKKAFELLELARFFSKVNSVNPDGIPLEANIKHKYFKPVFLDIGLLSNLNGYYQITSKTKQNPEFKGLMAEQFIGQELRFHFNNKLFYWKREKQGSSAEVDYMIQNGSKAIPIEVKSGKKGRLTSLHLLLEKYPEVEKALIFTEGGAGRLDDQKIEFLPLFAVVNSQCFE